VVELLHHVYLLCLRGSTQESTKRHTAHRLSIGRARRRKLRAHERSWFLASATLDIHDVEAEGEQDQRFPSHRERRLWMGGDLSSHS
jgi:hypothetical protein